MDGQPQPAAAFVVTDYFEVNGWPVRVLPDEGAIGTGFRGDHGQWTCAAQAFDAPTRFLFYSLCPLLVSPVRLAGMAEFVARSNYGLVVGNFELDFSDGEIRYKTSVDAGADALTHELIDRCVMANVVTMDRYLPGITMVLNGDRTPEEAVAVVEGSSS